MRVNLFNSFALAGALLALHVDALNLREQPQAFAETEAGEHDKPSLKAELKLESATEAEAEADAEAEAIGEANVPAASEDLAGTLTTGAKTLAALAIPIAGTVLGVKAITEVGGLMGYGCSKGNYGEAEAAAKAAAAAAPTTVIAAPTPAPTVVAAAPPTTTTPVVATAPAAGAPAVVAAPVAATPAPTVVKAS